MRRVREIWVAIVEQYERSGLTQESFAEKRRIPVATLRSWIYRLRREKQKEAPLLPVRVVTSPPPKAGVGAVEAGPIELLVGETVRLRFSAGTPSGVIADVVAALRERC